MATPTFCGFLGGKLGEGVTGTHGTLNCARRFVHWGAGAWLAHPLLPLPYLEVLGEEGGRGWYLWHIEVCPLLPLYQALSREGRFGLG